MAVGRRWTEEETRRALELYQSVPFGQFHQNNPKIINIANEIDRSPSSVAMKLSNFASLDPKIIESGRKGLSETTELDRQVWADFHNSTPSSATTESSADTTLPSGRVWVTSFWGFNPEGDGYLGFTRESDRDWFLQRWRPGDLVMVYATKGAKTEEAERGRVLGILEIAPKRIRDVERMSPAGRQWKIDQQVTARWSYAVPVVRAWRTIDLPLAAEIAPETLRHSQRLQIISSRGDLLTSEEAAAALAVRVRPTDVYGETPLTDEEKAKVYTPSEGFPMSFGKKSFETKDGAHFLYALCLDANPSVLLDDPEHALRGKVVVKVGLAKDPVSRCAQLNSALPPAGKMKWKVSLQSRALVDGQAALDAETALKQAFDKVYRSLGGEFFLCDAKTLTGEFTKAHLA